MFKVVEGDHRVAVAAPMGLSRGISNLQSCQYKNTVTDILHIWLIMDAVE